MDWRDYPELVEGPHRRDLYRKKYEEMRRTTGDARAFAERYGEEVTDLDEAEAAAEMFSLSDDIPFTEAADNLLGFKKQGPVDTSFFMINDMRGPEGSREEQGGLLHTLSEAAEPIYKASGSLRDLMRDKAPSVAEYIDDLDQSLYDATGGVLGTPIFIDPQMQQYLRHKRRGYKPRGAR